MSWRVAILPFIGQRSLYEKFHLDEPWDSPHNKALLGEIPAVYVPVVRGDEPGNSTYYLAIVGPGATFDAPAGTKLEDIKDGPMNTLLVVEAARPVPWTKPEDLPFDVKKPLPKVGGLFGGGFNAVFVDGSVRFLPREMNANTLRALITRSGAEVVNAGMLEALSTQEAAAPPAQPAPLPPTAPSGTKPPGS